MEWIGGLLGWVILNLILVQRDTKLIDLNRDGIISGKELLVYFFKNWVSIILALLLTIFIIGWDLSEALFKASNSVWEGKLTDFHDLFYAMPSLFSFAIQPVIKLLTKASK